MSFPGFPAPPGPGSPPSPSTHNLLSATHADTVAASGVSGDFVRANSSGLWERLPVGTEGQVIGVQGGVPTWIDNTASASTTGVVTNTITSGIGTTVTVSTEFVTLISAGTTNVNLPGVPASGQRHVLKDAAGTAGSSPITVSGLNAITIDGNAIRFIASNWGSMSLIYGGTEWHII